MAPLVHIQRRPSSRGFLPNQAHKQSTTPPTQAACYLVNGSLGFPFGAGLSPWFVYYSNATVTQAFCERETGATVCHSIAALHDVSAHLHTRDHSYAAAQQPLAPWMHGAPAGHALSPGRRPCTRAITAMYSATRTCDSYSSVCESGRGLHGAIAVSHDSTCWASCMLRQFVLYRLDTLDTQPHLMPAARVWQARHPRCHLAARASLHAVRNVLAARLSGKARVPPAAN